MSLEQLSICATFIATISALIIFKQWRKQKGSEVIANECKDGFKDILEMAKTISDIKNGFNLNSSLTIKEKIEKDIEKFESINLRVVRNLLFVDATIIESDLINYINEYNESYMNVISIVKTKMKFYGIKNECKIQEFYEKFLYSTRDITKIYKPYLLYQKTPKFRKKPKSA